MWRKLLIASQVILIIWILQTNWARALIGGAVETFREWTGAVVSVPDRQKIMSLRDDFTRNNMSLQPHQTDYVIEVTENAESIRKFYKLYCIGEDKNPYLYGFNLDRFCQLIGDSGLLVIEKS